MAKPKGQQKQQQQPQKKQQTPEKEGKGLSAVMAAITKAIKPLLTSFSRLRRAVPELGKSLKSSEQQSRKFSKGVQKSGIVLKNWGDMITSVNSRFIRAATSVKNLGQSIRDVASYGFQAKDTLLGFGSSIANAIRSYSPAQAKQIEVSMGRFRATIGQILAPATKQVSNLFVNLSKKLLEFKDKVDIKKVIKTAVFGLLIALIAGFIISLGFLAAGVGAIIGIIISFVSGIVFLAKSLIVGAFRVAMFGVQVVRMVFRLAVATVYVGKTMAIIAWTIIKGLASVIAWSVKAAFQLIVFSIKATITVASFVIRGAVMLTMFAIQGTVAIVSFVIKAVPALVSFAISGVTAVFSFATSAAKGLQVGFSVGLQVMSSFVGNLKQMMISAGSALVSAGRSVAMAVAGMVTSLTTLKLSVIISTLAQVGLNIAHGIFAIITSPVTLAIVGMVLGLIVLITVIWMFRDEITEFFQNIWDSICKFFEDIWDQIVGIFDKIVDQFRSFYERFFKPIIDKVWGTIKGVWEKIKNFLTWLWNKIKRFVGGGGGGGDDGGGMGLEIPGLGPELAGLDPKKFANDLKSSLGDPNKMVDAGANMLENAGMKDMADGLRNLSAGFDSLFADSDGKGVGYEATEAKEGNVEDLGKEARKAALGVSLDPQKKTAEAATTTAQNTGALRDAVATGAEKQASASSSGMDGLLKAFSSGEKDKKEAQKPLDVIKEQIASIGGILSTNLPKVLEGVTSVSVSSKGIQDNVSGMSPRMDTIRESIFGLAGLISDRASLIMDAAKTHHAESTMIQGAIVREVASVNRILGVMIELQSRRSGEVVELLSKIEKNSSAMLERQGSTNEYLSMSSSIQRQLYDMERVAKNAYSKLFGRR